MEPIKDRQDLRPVSDLESHAGDMVRLVNDTGRPVMLTRQGQSVAVLLSVAAFEALQAARRQLALQQAVEEAERESSEEHWVDHAEVEPRLREWASGRWRSNISAGTAAR